MRPRIAQAAFLSLELSRPVNGLPNKMIDPDDNHVSALGAAPCRHALAISRRYSPSRQKYREAPMKFQGNAFLQTVVIVFGFAALSQTGRANDISGLYVGGNLGLARIDYDNALYQKEIESAVSGTGILDFTNASLRKRNAAWWVDAGYMVSPYIGIEADYIHFGALYDHVVGKYTSNGGSTESVIATTSVRSDGPALGLVFRLPLTESFDINLRL